MNVYILKTILLFVLVLAQGCTKGGGPDEVYEKYFKSRQQGHTLEEDARYYSQSKWTKMQSQWKNSAKRRNKTKEEVTEFYLSFSKAVLRCKEIRLHKKEIVNNKAYLIYDQQDICGNPVTTKEEHLVHMVNEDGWKIDQLDIKI